jgi:hypothetical protein
MNPPKDSSYRDRFLNVANDELNALQNYANSFSELSHVVMGSSNTPSSLDSSHLLLHYPSFRSSDSESNSTLQNHIECLETLRQSHSKLKTFVSTIHTSLDPTTFKLFSEHIELSTRVLLTCASSSSSKGFGPLHENGLLKNIREDGYVDWHEVRMVSLNSLRASIERIKMHLD